MSDSGRFADVHSIFCYAHRVSHDHGVACHGSCPTCSGDVNWPDRMEELLEEMRREKS